MPSSSNLLLAPTALKPLLVIPVSLLLFTAVWHIVYYFNPAIPTNRPVAWHRAFNFVAITVCTCLLIRAQFNSQKDLLRRVPFLQAVPVLSCGASQLESLPILLLPCSRQLRCSLICAIFASLPLATLAALVRCSKSVEELWRWAVGIIGVWTTVQQLIVFGFCLLRFNSTLCLRNDPRGRRFILCILLVSLGTSIAAVVLVILQYTVHLPFSLLWVIVYPAFISELLLMVFWAIRLVLKWDATRKEENRVQQVPDIVVRESGNITTSSVRSLVPNKDESIAATFFL